MPVGPFAALGWWKVFDHDGSMPRTGPASKIRIVGATRKTIKFTRRCARSDPLGTRVRRAKVVRWSKGTYRASVGGFQYIESCKG